jgi:hypothetical protein
MTRIFIATLLLFSITIGTLQAQDQTVVTDAKVTFYVPARTDDKDVNTQVSATLYTAMGKRVAALEQCCGNIRYPDANYTSSTYQLAMRNTVFKSELTSGYFDVHIDAQGNDRWVLIPTFQLSFSDGTTVIIKGAEPGALYTRREVSQQAPDTSFPFHL